MLLLDMNHKNQPNIQKELTKEEAVRLFMVGKIQNN